MTEDLPEKDAIEVENEEDDVEPGLLANEGVTEAPDVKELLLLLLFKVLEDGAGFL